MDKKKAVAVVLSVAALGVLGYVLVPMYFDDDASPAPRNDAAKIRAELPKKTPTVASAPAKQPEEEPKNADGPSTGKMPDLVRANEPMMEAPESAKAVLPVSPRTQSDEERRLQATLREHDLKKVAHEYKRALRKYERETIEDEVALEKALSDADRIKAERAYYRANPSQLLVKNQPPVGGPGMPPVTPMPNGPGAGSSGSVSLDGFDQPALRMISMVGNEKVAHIEYRGTLYRVKSGDSLATWKVKTVFDESVQISSGKTVKTLQFGMPTGETSGSTTPLQPPPGAGSVPRRAGNT